MCVYPVFQASWRLSCWAATAEEYWFRQQTGRARGCRTLSPAGGEAMNESKWRDSNMLHWLITGCQWLKLSLSNHSQHVIKINFIKFFIDNYKVE